MTSRITSLMPTLVFVGGVVQRLVDPDQRHAGDQLGERAVHHQRVHPLGGLPHLGEHAADDRGKPEEVQDQHNVLEDLHCLLSLSWQVFPA